VFENENCGVNDEEQGQIRSTEEGDFGSEEAQLRCQGG